MKNSSSQTPKPFYLFCNTCQKIIPKEDVGVRRALYSDELVAICFCHEEWFTVRFSVPEVLQGKSTSQRYVLEDIEHDYEYYLKCAINGGSIHDIKRVPDNVSKVHLQSNIAKDIELEEIDPMLQLYFSYKAQHASSIKKKHTHYVE